MVGVKQSVLHTETVLCCCSLHVQEEPSLNRAANLVHLLLALQSREGQDGKSGRHTM